MEYDRPTRAEALADEAEIRRQRESRDARRKRNAEGFLLIDEHPPWMQAEIRGDTELEDVLAEDVDDIVRGLKIA
jgi:hypothetical protein